MKKELNQEELFKEEYNKFIQWAFNTGWTYYIDLNQWRKSVQYKTTNELHDIYKTVVLDEPKMIGRNWEYTMKLYSKTYRIFYINIYKK